MQPDSNNSVGAANWRGWEIILMAFVANMAVTGISFYAFGVFFKPLTKVFGWSREMVAWGPGVALIVSACCAPLAGKLADRVGIRPLLIGGSVGGALALALLGFIGQLWQYFLLFGFLLSLSNLHMGEIVTHSAVARRFPDKSGVAVGMAAVGMSFGGVVMPPTAQWILHNYGWRVGFVAMGAFVILLVFIPAVFFLKKQPDESVASAQVCETVEYKCKRSWTRGEALRSIRFWKLVFVFITALWPLPTMLVQQVPFLTDMGISPTNAAWVLSLSALCGMTGKIFWGVLFDRIEGRIAIGASLALQAIALMWLLQANSLQDAILFAIFFGLGYGGIVPMHTAMRARHFGAGNLGAIMGVSGTIVMLFQATGQPIAGRAFDTTGSYSFVFKLFIVAYLLGFLVVLTIKDPKEDEFI